MISQFKVAINLDHHSSLRRWIQDRGDEQQRAGLAFPDEAEEWAINDHQEGRFGPELQGSADHYPGNCGGDCTLLVDLHKGFVNYGVDVKSWRRWTDEGKVSGVAIEGNAHAQLMQIRADCAGVIIESCIK